MVSSPEMKLVDNTYRDVNFAFGNEVAKLCNEIEGVNSSLFAWVKWVMNERMLLFLKKDPHILSQSASEMGVI